MAEKINNKIKETNVVKKIILEDIYDIVAMENKLNAEAGNGLFLQRYGILSTFIKDDARIVTYKMVPIDTYGEIAPSRDAQTFYQNCGWNFICTIKDNFFLYMAEGNRKWSEHTPNETLSENFEFLSKRLKKAFKAQFLTSIVLVAMLIYTFFSSPLMVYNTIKYNNGYAQMILILLFAILNYTQYASYKSIARITQCLKNDKNIFDKKINNKKIVKVTSVLLLVLMLIIPTYAQVKKYHINLEDNEKVLPMILLNMVEQNEYYHRYNPVAYGDKQLRNTNCVYYTWSPLAPIQYHIKQQGIVENEFFNNTTQQYKPSSNVEYYEVRFESLAKPMYDNLLHLYQGVLDNSKKEEFELGGFDEAVLYRDGLTEYFFGRVGKSVIVLTYEGNHSIIPFIPEIKNTIDYKE